MISIPRDNKCDACSNFNSKTQICFDCQRFFGDFRLEDKFKSIIPISEEPIISVPISEVVLNEDDGEKLLKHYDIENLDDTTLLFSFVFDDKSSIEFKASKKFSHVFAGKIYQVISKNQPNKVFSIMNDTKVP